MIRLPVSEKGFALALIGSAAIHGTLLSMLLSSTSGSATRFTQPMVESCIQAFLVPGTLDAAGKTMPSPGRKGQQAGREAPPVVAVAPPQDVPKQDAPVKKEDRNLPADVETPAERFGKERDASAISVLASRPLPVLAPGEGELSGINGADISSAHHGSGEFPEGSGSGNTAARRGSGVFSEGNGAGATASRRKEIGGTRQDGGGAWPTKDADAVPRYGDNVRPTYPQLARLRGYQGVVVLLVDVLVDGRVRQVGIRRSAGHEILDRAALEAVRMWRFEPGRREGRAVTMSVEVPVRFVLNEYSAW